MLGELELDLDSFQGNNMNMFGYNQIPANSRVMGTASESLFGRLDMMSQEMMECD